MIFLRKQLISSCSIKETRKNDKQIEKTTFIKKSCNEKKRSNAWFFLIFNILFRLKSARP